MSDDGTWIEDEDQIVRLKANYVISAFGSGLRDTDIHKAMEPVKVRFALNGAEDFVSCSFLPLFNPGLY